MSGAWSRISTGQSASHPRQVDGREVLGVQQEAVVLSILRRVATDDVPMRIDAGRLGRRAVDWLDERGVTAAQEHAVG